MRRFLTVAIAVIVFVLAGCTPLERTAYQTVVAAKGFLDSEKAQNPSCGFDSQTVVVHTKTCDAIRQAIGAKDSLINALEVYCSGPQFENGGACQPPAKGTPTAQQAVDKLKAAITNYNQIASDLKQATGGH